MNDYYQDKKQKQNDFWKGFLTNLIVGLIAAGLYFVLWGLTFLFDAKTVKHVIRGIAIAIIVTVLAIYEIRTIRRHLKERRYIAIGMIAALLIPLLAVGTCSPLIFIA